MGRARPQEGMMELLTSNHIVCSRLRGNDRQRACTRGLPLQESAGHSLVSSAHRNALYASRPRGVQRGKGGGENILTEGKSRCRDGAPATIRMHSNPL
jgi:hypothetical protein